MVPFVQYRYYGGVMHIKIVDNRVFSEIWVDGEMYKEIHKALYKKYVKDILCVPSTCALQTLLAQLDTKIARALVYKYLACKGYMTEELEKKLTIYKIGPAAIKRVLQECRELGYLDDQREAQLFVNTLKRKGWGPNMISLKLRSRTSGFCDFAKISDQEQRKMVHCWIEKKKKNQDFSDVKTKQKLYRFLKGKGFEEEIILQELMHV